MDCISKEIVEEFNNIKWFEHCGEEFDFKDMIRSKNTASTLKSISGTKWENTVLDKEGDVTAKLSQRQTDKIGNEYAMWNILVKEFKEKYLSLYEDIWKEKLSELGLDDKSVLDDVKFNILSIAMLYTYKEIVGVPEFFEKLLMIYKSGHLPCGWKGTKSEGNIIVY